MAFNFSSFVTGLRLIDGGDLLAFANFFFSAQQNIVAAAGGGAANAVVLTKANNVLSVVANANDSVMLPPSGNMPVGVVVTVVNHGAQTVAVFGNTNPGPGLPADQIVGSAASAGAASVTQAATKVANYELIQPGTLATPALWKQFASA